ncbi:crc [Trypoxylus dichotomus]
MQANMALYLFAARYPANAFIALNSLSLSISSIQASTEHKYEFFTDLEQPELKLETENVPTPQTSEVDSEMVDNLDNIEDLNEWIKQEPFTTWLDEKLLPISMFDMDATVVTPSKTDPIKSDTSDTQSLLKEFETVLDYVNPGTLTPPQSPPYVQQPLLTTLEPVATQNPPTYVLSAKEHPIYHIAEKQVPDILYSTSPQPESLQTSYGVPQTPQSIDRELAAVEELVRSRAQDMVQWSNPPSPTCSNSNSGSFDDSSSEDPEWVPEPVEELAFPTKKTKRYKPYSRVSPEDKKSRKKEQNKNAATRYRLKKKAEVEEILNEERAIQKENDELGNKVSDLQREIRYLKGLMRDLFKAKGLIQ